MNLRNNFLKVTVLLAVILVVCLAAGCVSSSDSNQDGLKIVNSDGTITDIPGEAERTVLLNSNAGEILFMMDEADRVVGISQSIANNKEQRDMYPNAKVVGSWDNPDVESLRNLNADLIIGYTTSKPKNEDELKKLGIPIVYLDCTKPNKMTSDVIELGKIVGNKIWSNAIAAFYLNSMEIIRYEADKFSTSPKIYVESYTDNYGQGNNTGLDQLIDLTGGTNIMKSVNGSQKVSNEWIVSEKPDIIIKLVNSMDNKESILKSITERPGYDTIPAVKNNNVWLIRNDITYGPRACIGALAFLKIIHPESLPGVTPESSLKEINNKFGTSYEGYTFNTENITYPAIKQ